MTNQSTLPFACLLTPVKSPQSTNKKKRNSSDARAQDCTAANAKRAKPNLPSPEVDEVEEQVDVIEVEDNEEQQEKQPQTITNHKQQKQALESKAQSIKDQEKKVKRLKIEEEKKRKELKKKEMEEARLQKKQQIELEKQRRKEEFAERKLELERKKLELEKLKEEKRLLLELKKAKLELEKEERRLKLELEKLQRQKERELAEKKKKEEEERKNRAQAKIASFFQVKKKTSEVFGVACNGSKNNGKVMGSGQVIASDGSEGKIISQSNDSTPQAPISHYDSTFLLFFVKENAELFMKNCLTQDEINLNTAKFDSSLDGGASHDHWDFFQTCLNSFKTQTSSSSAFDIVQAINNNHSETEIMRLVEKVPRKYFSFYENLRPAYSGTVSNTIELIRTKYGIELNVNPFVKVPDDLIDYTYDSDLEWNPEEDDEGEGEELDEEEMSANDQSDDEEDDYADFLEDDKQFKKKKILIGPLVPVIKTYADVPDESEEFLYFNSLLVEPLRLDLPIDPLLNYWKKSSEVVVATVADGMVHKLPAAKDQSVIGNGVAPLSANNNTINVLTGHKKPKKVIVERNHLLELLKLVHAHRDYSLQTLKEMTSRKLNNKYSYLVVDETIKKYFYKKDNKTYELKDLATITNLEDLIKAGAGEKTGV